MLPLLIAMVLWVSCGWPVALAFAAGAFLESGCRRWEDGG
jgi:hypothetical protein